MLNNQKLNEKLKDFAPAILRIGISLVFLWFGLQQITGPQSWAILVPEYATSLSQLSATTIVYINGTLEIVLGILLLVGLFTRIVAFILALHLVLITIDVGYNAIGVRDFGLLIASIAVTLFGADKWSLDMKMNKSDVFKDRE